MTENKALTRFEPFQIIERIEDELILAEIRGEILRDYVYSFKDSSGRIVEGLSKAGVDAVVSEMAHKGEAIRELDLNWTEDGKCYKVTVKAGRYAVAKDGSEVLLDSAFGAKRQSKTLITKDNEEIENPFAFELAIVKAARNAKRRLIPESLAVEIIERAKTEGRTRVVPPVSTRQVAAPAVKAASKSPTAKPAPKTEETPSTTAVTELGFSSELEQKQLRAQLLSKLLPAVGKKTIEEKEDWLKTKDASPTTSLTKARLEELIKEVTEAKALIDKAESLEENL